MRNLHEALLDREIDPVSVLLRLALLRRQGGSTAEFYMLVDEQGLYLLDEQGNYLID